MARLHLILARVAVEVAVLSIYNPRTLVERVPCKRWEGTVEVIPIWRAQAAAVAEVE